MQLRQIAREYLRNQNDPFKIVEDYMEHGDDEQMRLFEDHLQDYYPVTRKDAPEESPRSIYIPIEQLTHTDVARICSRMDKASGALAKHSRNLMAWFMSRAA